VSWRWHAATIVTVGIAASCATAREHESARSGSVPIAELPVQLLLGRVPFLRMRIADSEQLNAIIDTGANDDILNARVVRALRLTVHDPQRVTQPGGAVEMGRLDSVSLHIANAPLRLPMTSVPLDALQPFIGQRVDAILGFGFFQRYVVELDYATAHVRLFDPASYVAPAGYVSLPLTFRGKSPLVQIALLIAGEDTVYAWVELDTGSFESLGLKGSFVQAHSIVSPDAPRIPLFGLAIGGETSGFRTRLKAFRLGPFTFEQPVAAVTTSSNADVGESDIAGVIGGEALRRFTVIIDYSRHRILLAPNESYHHASEYFDFLGAQIIALGDSFDRFHFTQIMAGSPAALGDLKPDDELLEIDHQKVRTLDQVLSAFGAPGEHHVLLILRNGRSMTIEITTRRLV
jgi:hypothetical protein